MAETTSALMRVAQALGKPTAFFGQGIGPFRSERSLRTCATSLRRAGTLCLREGVSSPRWLQRMGLSEEHVRVTGDDALAVALAKRSASRTAIGVNIRRATYAKVDPELQGAIAKAVTASAQRLGAALVGVPVSLYDSEDVLAIRQLFESSLVRDDGASVARPEDLVQQISECRVVVTGSYHAGVFALAQGVPVVGLAASDYYVEKFRGLQRQFGDGCRVVLLQAGSAADQIEEAVRWGWNLSDEVRDRLTASARGQVELQERAYDEFAAVLARRRGTGAVVC
jgi:polysaccharide pyruvyl transferase WcaK-like protein